jgi:Na+-transporting NADH:ubiquinone oxidoreductase subunit NqrA
LGRYHHHITVLRDGSEQDVQDATLPGVKTLAALQSVLSKALGNRPVTMPSSLYKRLLPAAGAPAQLLRALLRGDTHKAAALGALGLVEEDLALASLAFRGKVNLGERLRDVLDELETIHHAT